ncbi:MAG: 3-oxoacyl-ACP reductase FabG [Candidatus Saccharibacteria bacterium]
MGRYTLTVRPITTGIPMNAYASLQATGLDGKVVIITGGAQGIGLATARRFCAEGSQVVIADLKNSEGAARVFELRQLGFDATFMPLDVTDESAANLLADQVVETFGRIDVLVNNAGITADGRVAAYNKETDQVDVMSYERWSRVLQVNLDGSFLCSRAVLRHMVPKKSGCLLFASSIVAATGNFGQGNYAASKTGVIGLAQTLAIELGSSGIRVNVVAPGFTETPMVATVPEKVLDGFRKKTPLRRLALPEDIANAYVWLAGNQAAFVTGIVLPVAGGLTL